MSFERVFSEGLDVHFPVLHARHGLLCFHLPDGAAVTRPLDGMSQQSFGSGNIPQLCSQAR